MREKKDGEGGRKERIEARSVNYYPAINTAREMQKLVSQSSTTKFFLKGYNNINEY